MVSSTGAVTVRLVVPATVPDLAVIVVAVEVTANVLSHAKDPETVTVAILVSATDHATAPVISREEPLLKVPVAVTWLVVSLASVGVVGVIDIAVRVPPVTLRLAVPVMLSKVALIEVVPCARVVTVPLVLIVAMVGLDEAQAT
jgi:hypothetical protein